MLALGAASFSSAGCSEDVVVPSTETSVAETSTESEDCHQKKTTAFTNTKKTAVPAIAIRRRAGDQARLENIGPSMNQQPSPLRRIMDNRPGIMRPSQRNCPAQTTLRAHCPR